MCPKISVVPGELPRFVWKPYLMMDGSGDELDLGGDTEVIVVPTDVETQLLGAYNGDGVERKS